MKLLTALVAVAFSLVATAHAQVVYKSTMPDGKVVYSEKPVPGAKKVDTIEPPPAKSGITMATPEEQARAEQLAKDRAKTSATAAARQSEIDEARKQLKRAEAARDSGKEEVPGERLGMASGKTRLSEAYFERQKKLEQAVEEARKRLAELEKAAR